MKKTFRSTLAALVCGAVALVGCSTDSVSTNTTDQELREKISNSGELPNPRDLEGVDEVKDFGEPVPVAGNPSPTLPVELTDADGYDVTVTDISRILALDLYGSYTKPSSVLAWATTSLAAPFHRRKSPSRTARW